MNHVVDEGQAKAIGVLSEERFPQFTDAMTFKEAGIDLVMNSARGYMPPTEYNVRQHESKKRLFKATRRCDEIDTLIKKLYETYVLGKIPENHFDRMITEYDSEQ
jgi:tripartite-type tricarboxylate transporter receptor subunit TctC